MHVCFVLRWKLHLDNEKSNFPHFLSFFSLEKQANDEELATGVEGQGKKYQPAKAPIVKAPLFSPATQKFMAAL